MSKPLTKTDKTLKVINQDLFGPNLTIELTHLTSLELIINALKTYNNLLNQYLRANFQNKAISLEDSIRLRCKIRELRNKLTELKQVENQKTKASEGLIKVETLRKLHKREIEIFFQQFLRILKFTYKLIERTVEGVGKVAGPYALPITVCFTGLKALWDFFISKRDKFLGQRKTRLTAAIANLVAVGLIIGLMCNPLGFSILCIFTMSNGLYKLSYITHQTKKKIAKEKSTLKQAKSRKEILENEFEELLQLNGVNVEDIRKMRTTIGELNKIIQDLTVQITKNDTPELQTELKKHNKKLKIAKYKLKNVLRNCPNPDIFKYYILLDGAEKEVEIREKKLKELKDKYQELHSKTAFYAAGVLGASLCLAGLFFPPLLIAGTCLLVSASIMYTINENTNRSITRLLSKTWGNIKSFFQKEAPCKQPTKYSTKSTLSKCTLMSKGPEPTLKRRSSSADLLDTFKKTNPGLERSPSLDLTKSIKNQWQQEKLFSSKSTRKLKNEQVSRHILEENFQPPLRM